MLSGVLKRVWTSIDFVPRMSFFFNAHNDFFEEIAKYRAARRIWAREMRDRFGQQYERTLQTAFPHADGGRLADGATAAEQHRARRDSGTGGSVRRHAKSAHRCLR